MYAVEELSNLLCPWCIGDGSAAAKYDAYFIGDPIGDDVPLRS
ncbi:CbrC family protein [Streptomyces rochei]|nr:CbrC family protein [Streptomyces sp. UP1A-1]